MKTCRQCEIHDRMSGGSNPFMYHKCPRHDERTESQKIGFLHQAALDEQEENVNRKRAMMESF